MRNFYVKLVLVLLLAGSVMGIGGLPETDQFATDRTKSSLAPEVLIYTHPWQSDETIRWGGEGIILTTGKTSASLDFGCGRASVSGGLRTNRRGKFSVDGMYFPSSGIRTTVAARSIAIRVEGQISGKRMTVKVTNTESREVMGNYVLEKGKQVRLSRCQ